MFQKLQGVEDRFIKLERLLSDPSVMNDRALYQKYIKEHGEITKLVEVYREYKQNLEGLEDSRELLNDDDPEMKESDIFNDPEINFKFGLSEQQLERVLGQNK